MGKTKSSFFCSNCGHESSGWLGRCPGCGSWNSMQETLKENKNKNKRGTWTNDFQNVNIPLVEQIVSIENIETGQTMRQATSLAELDRVLGGGFVEGSLVLLGGDPGIGKSTLLLQVAGSWPRESKVLYISGEESPEQIKMRADRLNIATNNIHLLAVTNFAAIKEAILAIKADITIIDSIQTMYHEDLTAAPGSVSQVREVTAGLLRLAKQTPTTIVLVGHVTKDGAIAGPRVLEHMVDTVLYFEGKNLENYRLLRAVKNRFGATDELGIFEMTAKGLQSIENTSLVLLAGRPQNVAGSVVTACIEGTRPVLLEIQALVTPSSGNFALRSTQGFDRNRLNMLLATAEKHLDINFQDFDTYVNVIGGLKIHDTSADLAVLSAVLSSYYGKPVKEHCLINGEIGLTGEIRAIAQGDKRAAEASRLGLESYILPSANKRHFTKKALTDVFELYFVDRIKEAIDIIFS